MTGQLFQQTPWAEYMESKASLKGDLETLEAWHHIPKQKTTPNLWRCRLEVGINLIGSNIGHSPSFHHLFMCEAACRWYTVDPSNEGTGCHRLRLLLHLRQGEGVDDVNFGQLHGKMCWRYHTHPPVVLKQGMRKVSRRHCHFKILSKRLNLHTSC